MYGVSEDLVEYSHTYLICQQKIFDLSH
jgi:hypothetical protein